jgi:hypothetical protein
MRTTIAKFYETPKKRKDIEPQIGGTDCGSVEEAVALDDGDNDNAGAPCHSH